MPKRSRPSLKDDTLRERLAAVGLNLGVAWYLMASYAYYWEDDPILSDAAFDELSKLLLAGWEGIQHPHKKLITVEDLKAGSLLLKKEEYPSIILGALKNLRRTDE
jgi:hypothetical protein